MALTDRAISQIKSMIVDGTLRPGDKLPPEKELSERLGLSRSSMREAVKALELARVLDVRQGDGTYVTSLETRLLLESLVLAVELSQDTSLLEFFEVRRLLEPAASSMAALSDNVEERTRLVALANTVSEESTVDEVVAHDTEFHRAVAEITGNSYLVSILESLAGATAHARIWRGLTQEGSLARTRVEHLAIAEAIAAGDSKLAQALALVHISGVENWLRTSLAGESASSSRVPETSVRVARSETSFATT